MRYKVLRGIIQWKKVWDIVDMDFDLAKKYWPNYLEIDKKPIEEREIQSPPPGTKAKMTWEQIKAEAWGKVDKFKADRIKEIAVDHKIDIFKEDGKNFKSKKTLIEELNILTK